MGCVIIEVSVLASGSKGNCTLVCVNGYKILIDLGVSCLCVERNLKELNICPSTINYVFITHTHRDHINGLKTFYKKYKPVVYLTKGMYKELKNEMEIEECVYINGEDNFELNELLITVIKTSHDTEESNGYIFEYNNKTIAYITDTGYINEKYHSILKNKTMYIMESNHDVGMLMKTRRPHFLKIRIIGDEGHLSNNEAAMYLGEFIGSNTKKVVLAHLSEEANSPQLAKKALKKVLEEKEKQVKRIIIANQTKRTELIKI